MTNITMLSRFIPQKCGIAEFSHSLYEAINSNFPQNIQVVAVNTQINKSLFPDPVKMIVEPNCESDYIKAASFINDTSDVVILQHEYGLFGSNYGENIIPLLENINVPIILTLHTILKEMPPQMKRVFDTVTSSAKTIVVMSERGARILVDDLKINPQKVTIVPHGIPIFDYKQKVFSKKALGITCKNMISTFGLLSPSKGIETVIYALPKIIEKHPDTIYYVLGSLHPNEATSASGKNYLTSLQTRVQNLQLQEHVKFVDHYLSTSELHAYLQATDIYAIPYRNVKQITSGTLVYAMGVGTCIISTPFWHAEDYLAEGRGLLVDFDDPKGFEENIIHALDHPEKKEILQKAAYDFTRSMTWPNIARKYIDLLSIQASPQLTHV